MEKRDSRHLDLGADIEVHRSFGFGSFEQVYENGLAPALNLRGIAFAAQVPNQVFWKNVAVGDYIAHLLAENVLLIAVKSVQNSRKIHEVQLVHYLNEMRNETGPLLNFGGSSLQN